MAKSKTGATSAKAWKGKSEGVDLTLPSGNVCHAKRPGMQAFLSQGKVPNALMPVIMKAIESAKGGKKSVEAEIDMAEMFADGEKMAAIAEFQQAVLLATVKEPRLLPVPADESERDDDELYADEVDPIDAAFIFQWAMGGAADLERFRGELAEAVSDLPTGQEMEQSA